MSSRCRSCKGLLPAEHPTYPAAQLLAGIVPFTKLLMDAAAEYDSDEMSAGEQTPAADFVRWLDLDLRRAS